MGNKINIAELLKDCPSGMELDCTMYEDVKFLYVLNERDIQYPIVIKTKCGFETKLTKYGQNFNIDDAKCVIFPKGKTTWEGFQRPFKDGDVVATDFGSVFILKSQLEDKIHYHNYVGVTCYNEFQEKQIPFAYQYVCHLATEEEKEKLFDAIKANGYKWNAETKTLEKLIEPKFKVGDKIVKKDNPTECWYVQGVNTNCNSDYFYHIVTTGKIANLHFKDQDNWELVPNKFDITTLKPFDKVLVRDTNEQKWTVDMFSFYDKTLLYPFNCIGHYINQCIPYKGNEHLLGTTNDCNEYFKTWE